MSRESIFEEIHQERDRQDMKWGEQNHPIRVESDAIYFIDQARLCRQVCDYEARNGTLTWYHILIEEFFEAFAEGEALKQRYELVQVAAVAIAMIECIDRKSHDRA
jgi:hypothetical protein